MSLYDNYYQEEENNYQENNYHQDTLEWLQNMHEQNDLNEETFNNSIDDLPPIEFFANSEEEESWHSEESEEESEEEESWHSEESEEESDEESDEESGETEETELYGGAAEEQEQEQPEQEQPEQEQHNSNRLCYLCGYDGHLDDDAIECPQCNASFVSNFNLFTDLQSHKHKTI